MNTYSNSEINHSIQAFLQRNNFQKTLSIFRAQLNNLNKNVNPRHQQTTHLNSSSQKISKFIREIPKMNMKKHNEAELRQFLQKTDQRSLKKVVQKMKRKLRNQNLKNKVTNHKETNKNPEQIAQMKFFKKLMQKQNKNINQHQVITINDLRQSKINYNPLQQSMQQENQWNSSQDQGFQIIEDINFKQLSHVCAQINMIKNYQENSIKMVQYPELYYKRFNQIRQKTCKNFYDGLSSKLPSKVHYDNEKQYSNDKNDIYPIESQNTTYGSFDLKIIYDRSKTGFQQQRDIKIIINQVLAGKYQVISNYGIGQFSKAIQVQDLTTRKRYCMKIISNNKYYFDQSIDQIKILRFIQANCDTDQYNLLTLYDYFYHKQHLIILTELLQQDLYRTYQQRLDYFSLSTVQAMTKQILKAVDKLHSLNIIHTDLKPQNILIKSYSNKTVKVIDLGSSIFFSDPLGYSVQTLTYRAPEVILGIPYDQKIDIWSLGCIIAEIFSGQVLFNGDNQTQILAKIQGLRGPWPSWMIETGKFVNKYFTNDMIIFEPKVQPQESQIQYHSDPLQLKNLSSQIENCRVYIPKTSNLRSRVGTDNKIFLDFLSKCLKIDPTQRISAKQALNHPFITQLINQ